MIPLEIQGCKDVWNLPCFQFWYFFVYVSASDKIKAKVYIWTLHAKAEVSGFVPRRRNEVVRDQVERISGTENPSQVFGGVGDGDGDDAVISIVTERSTDPALFIWKFIILAQIKFLSTFSLIKSDREATNKATTIEKTETKKPGAKSMWLF